MNRFRDYGFRPGLLTPGPLNTISDVAGVTVGHVTRIEGERIRTGVTVIDPGPLDLFFRKLPAAVAVGNGFGKLAGATQIAELGTLETPIALTNTLAVGPALQGLVELTLRCAADPGGGGPIPPGVTINGVVGETNDGFLNDIHRIVITPGDVAAAWEARGANFALGAVGAGTGTRCFGFKGGIGSASRMVSVKCGENDGREFTVGALLQTNFGGALTIMGVPIGVMLGRTDFDEFLHAVQPFQAAQVSRPANAVVAAGDSAPHIQKNPKSEIRNPKSKPVAAGDSATRPPDGSCMMILATDAPLTARQLGRLARRAVLGLARAGSIMGQGSGDYAIAFSTSRAGVEGAGNEEASECAAIAHCLPDSALNPLFLAAVEAVEESVYDSLFMSETVTGRDGHTAVQLPLARVVELLHDRLRNSG